jgi:hypothetical protein
MFSRHIHLERLNIFSSLAFRKVFCLDQTVMFMGLLVESYLTEVWSENFIKNPMVFIFLRDVETNNTLLVNP